MSDQIVRQNIETTIEATVTRCRCGDPSSHVGERCPQGEKHNLGVIAYGHTDEEKDAEGKAKVLLNSIKNRKARLGR